MNFPGWPPTLKVPGKVTVWTLSAKVAVNDRLSISAALPGSVSRPASGLMARLRRVTPRVAGFHETLA